ncbi:type II secretion system F family protein [Corynebacterium sp.]|uniref:type II secretion system F family protein n=1 Tax=Corynebacterium sp. TaxID=1720 RepID=UPI003B3AFEEE
MVTVTALLSAVVVVVFTAVRVATAAVALATGRKRAREYRDFTDAFSVELLVGARSVDAAEQALTDGHGISGPLLRQIHRIRLGAPVDGGGGTDDPAQHDGELRRLLRLWAVAERRGLALGHLMGRVVEDLDARLAHLGHVSSALAGARMTEVILLLLPAGALGIGQSMGLEPAAFLIGNPLGALVLLCGTGLACTGVLWVESLTVTVLGGVGGRAGPGGQAGASGGIRLPGVSAKPGLGALAAARVLDVFAAAVEAGLPVVTAWRTAVHGAVQGARDDVDPAVDALLRVAGLLELGAGAAAWEHLASDPHFGPVARRAGSQIRNGGRLAGAVTAQADRLRRQAGDSARAGAERVLVAVAAPLTLCFLPAFVLVGLVPLIIGFAGA